MIRNLLASFVCIFLINVSAFSQLSSNYSFTALSGTYTALSGGTTVTWTDGGFGVPTDEGYSANIPIGFTFNYNGTDYTTLNASTNGFLSFGGFNGVSYANSLSSQPPNGRPVIAALWDDLDNTGPSSYATTGTAPNRVFTFQWTSVLWNWSASNPSASFQIKLYESTNVIEFVYQNLGGAVEDPAGQGDLGASIGITAAATGSGNFMSLNSSGASPTVSTTTSTNSIVAAPATGQIYRWTPWFYSYCPASANYTGPFLSEKISNVSFAAINNPSTGQVGYQDFTNVSTFVQPSTTYPLTVQLSNGWAADSLFVWIDFNHNGSFSDPGELVYQSGPSAGPFTGNITIPATSASVLLGKTRMRIRLEDSSSPPTNTTPCGNAEYGQVEDYTVDIENCVVGAITTQPTANTYICNGGNGTMSVATSGTGMNYQWQFSTNGGLSWGNVPASAPYSGTTTNTLTFTGATSGINGYWYRVLVTGTCTPLIASSSSALTITTSAAFTLNPINVVSCATANATFSVTASGTSPTYQWQVSTDNGATYNNISGATSTTLNLTGLTLSQNNNRYRAVATVAGCGSVTSSAAVLTVNAQPTVSIAAAPGTALMPGVTTTLTATSNPAAAAGGYLWTLNGNTVAGANANTLIVDVNGIGTYKATITDVNGCKNTTSAVVITADPTDKLFVYPNPSTGIFQIRLYAQNLYDVRSITVYNSVGVKVAQKDFNVNTRYDKMEFDLRHVAPGVYSIHIEHRYIKRKVIGQVVIVH